LKQHIEWFEASPAEAIAVIQRWSNWMITRPYQSIGLRSESETLKKEEKQRAGDIDQFMKETTVASVINLEKVERRASQASVSDAYT
jgi:hypothetical protein